MGAHPKATQVLAGHATCAVAMNIYTHVNMDFKREVSEALVRAIAAAQPEPEPAKARERAPKRNAPVQRIESLHGSCSRSPP